jgi:cbb3-type cytochrome oxidase subunit 3
MLSQLSTVMHLYSRWGMVVLLIFMYLCVLIFYRIFMCRPENNEDGRHDKLE